MSEPIERPSRLRMLWNILWLTTRASAGAYGISLMGFFVLRMVEGESVNEVALLNNMLHLMLLPALVLYPLMMIGRRWLAAVLLAFPFVMALTDNLPTFSGNPPTPPAGTSVTVLTYNLLSRSGDPSTFDETVSIIREADADIVLLQEVAIDSGAAIAELLAADYPYQALHPKPIGTQGQGVLSRYPVTADEFFQSPLPVQLGHQRVMLDIDGREVVIYNVHPIHPFMSPGLLVEYRSRDIAHVLERASDDVDSYPTIIAGDFNMTPKTDDYARLQATYSDAFLEAGFGFGYTFPDQPNVRGLAAFVPPLARLDYVFYDDTWQATAARVWDSSGGSDHRPLFVRLVLSGDTSTP